MKAERQEKIIDIVKNYDVETQEELIERLKDKGCFVTQATISRDIRELKLTKATGTDGRYKYVITSSGGGDEYDVYTDTLTRSIRRADYTSNMVVVHTYSGMAQAVAAGIDSHDSSEILGCVAGDDTILIILRDEERAVDYYRKISTFIK